MRHFQALVQIDSSDPPGNETRVAEYVKKVLEADGIPGDGGCEGSGARQYHCADERQRLQATAADHGAQRYRSRGSLQVDVPPFSAARQGGYVYGRGTLDDKSDLLAAMMTMLMLKRQKTQLDRDVIFVSEAGEEASTGPGIEYLVNQHWNDIDAEIRSCGKRRSAR